MCLSKKAKFHLSLFYGDKDKCIESLEKTMLRYQNCKNSNNPKILKRVDDYKLLIDELTTGG